MHIVCCIKQVPDTTQVKIDPATNTLVRAGVESLFIETHLLQEWQNVPAKKILPFSNNGGDQ